MKKITDLLKDIAEYPYTGIGKPEPLKYELAGYWSRRINSDSTLDLTEEVPISLNPSFRAFFHAAVLQGLIYW